jgi:hypothetical protein
MSGGNDKDSPYYGRARMAAAGGTVFTACVLALLRPDPVVIGLLLGFAAGALGVSELSRRLRGDE